jgi:hypothetical protein
MLETVHYPDEEPVTYKSVGDRYLLEALKYGLNLTIREVYPMLIRLLTDGLDPIHADGPEFKFGGFLDVPDPMARVSIIAAREECGRQIKTCQMLLEGPVDRAEAVLRNSIQWCRFWSVRAPTPELREMFGRSLNFFGQGLYPAHDKIGYTLIKQVTKVTKGSEKWKKSCKTPTKIAQEKA